MTFRHTTIKSLENEFQLDTESVAFVVNQIDEIIDPHTCHVALDRVEIHSPLTQRYISDATKEGFTPTEEESEDKVADFPRITNDFGDSQSEKRRSARRRVPNSRYANEYVSSSTILQAQRITSPKRPISPPVETSALTTKPPIPPPRKKRTKVFTISSPQRPTDVPQKKVYTTNVGTLTLRWPRFGMHSSLHEGQSHSVTNTCPLDTGLFILYHAYKSGGSEFRNLFETDRLPVFTTLRRTFQLVDSDSWDSARLHWLIVHNLLKNTTANGEYDIENTLTEIVFRFIQTMQLYTITSECSCVACPKQFRHTKSVDIVLR